MKQLVLVSGAFALIVAGMIACGGEVKPPAAPENPAGSAAVPEAPSAPTPEAPAPATPAP